MPESIRRPSRPRRGISRRSVIVAALLLGLSAGALAAWGVRGSQSAAAAPRAPVAAAPSVVPILVAQVQPGAAVPGGGPAQAVLLNSRYTTQVRPLLTKYCYSCHGNGKSKGDVALDKYVSLETVQTDRAVWQHFNEVVRHKLMPPEDKPQPTADEREIIGKWIDDALVFCDCSGPRDPGRKPIHRLNRVEYNNSVRELTGITFSPADDFPADDTGYGFDNIADVLTMSPLLAEKYLAAAEEIMAEAIPAEAKSNINVKRYPAAGNEFTGEGNRGEYLGVNGESFFFHEFTADGEYEIRIRAAQDKFGNEDAKLALKIDGKDTRTFDVRAARDKAEVLKQKVTVKAGKRRVAGAYLNNAKDPNNPDRRRRGDRNVYLEWFEVDGPLNVGPPEASEAYKRIFFVTPGQNGLAELEAARQIVAKFVTRAYRRPAAADEVESLLKIFREARGEGERFDQAVKYALTAVLVSPHFLFRIEMDPQMRPGVVADARGVYPISDYELASRLSYFLWSSGPDELLMLMAQTGTLRKPDVLEAQVRRMLTDPRARAFVDNFAGQWLELRNLEESAPDKRFYPAYSKELREDMRKETELFFENIIREDRNVLELLHSDYTYLNERLAKHYGIEGITGEEFRRVSLALAGPAGQRRGGVLTMGSVLTVTAMPARTSPVKRGKFVLEQLLAAPPPPPPPDVPALSEQPQDVSSAPLKKRLEAHREDPNCAVCHIKMDAIGFALENFDGIGAWRDKDGRFDIDATGPLPDGYQLTGPNGLKRMLLEKRSQFTNCITEKMLTYALGRGMEFYDQCTVKDIVADAERNHYRISSIVLGIVKSDAFQKRRIKADAPKQPSGLNRK